MSSNTFYILYYNFKIMTLFYFYDIFDYYDFKISRHKEKKELLMVQLSDFYTVMQLKSLFYLYRTP